MTTEQKQTQLATVPKQGEIQKPRDQVEQLGAYLHKAKKDLMLAATKHLDVDRLTRLAITAIRKTPALAKCTPVSVIASVMQCAQLGLEPDSVLGRVYLVPFKGECTVIVGYKGMIELALRSGLVETVEGYPVFEGDEFDYSLGLERRLHHKPCGETDAAKMTHAYAIVRFKDGGVLFSVMTRKAIDAVRNASPGKDHAPWVKHYPEMAVKTAIRRLWKFCPASPELARAASLEERGEAGISIVEDTELNLPAGFFDGEVVDAAGEPKPEKSKLDQIVDKKQKKHASDCGTVNGASCDCAEEK